MQYSISFRFQHSDFTFIYQMKWSPHKFEVITCHCTELLQYYWLESLCYRLNPCDLFIPASLYFLIPFLSVLILLREVPYSSQYSFPREDKILHRLTYLSMVMSTGYGRVCVCAFIAWISAKFPQLWIIGMRNFHILRSFQEMPDTTSRASEEVADNVHQLSSSGWLSGCMNRGLALDDE